MTRNYTGKNGPTYERGTKYISDVAYSEGPVVVQFRGSDRVNHADNCFASRQRDDDTFRFAEAFAQCSAILNSANEQAMIENPDVQAFANKQLALAFGMLSRWREGEK